MSRRIGEPGNGAGRIRGGRRRHRAHDARRPERHDHVAGTGAQAQGRRHVVARPDRHHHAGLRLAGDGPRRQHRRDVEDATEGPFEQVGAVVVLGGRPVAGAAGVAAVGHQVLDPTGGAHDPGQPVVREADRGDPGGELRFVRRQPPQLRHRERGDRHRTGGRRPCRGTELGDELGGGGRRPCVVPEQRRTDHGTVGVEGHETVLLSGDAEGDDVVVEAAGDGERLAQGGLPGRRVDLGARRVRCRRRPHERARRLRHARRPCRPASTSRRRRPSPGHGAGNPPLAR